MSRSRSNVGVSAGDILTDYNDLDIQSAVDEMESKVSEVGCDLFENFLSIFCADK